jgi:hypothetical protein
LAEQHYYRTKEGTLNKRSELIAEIWLYRLKHPAVGTVLIAAYTSNEAYEMAAQLLNTDVARVTGLVKIKSTMVDIDLRETKVYTRRTKNSHLLPEYRLGATAEAEPTRPPRRKTRTVAK